MEEEAPVIYGLEFQARSLCAQAGETDAIRFLVGTQALRADNQVHYIDFDDENNLINKTVYRHRDGEIWSMSASTFDPLLFSTCFNKTVDNKCQMQAAVFRLPDSGDTSGLDHGSPHSFDQSDDSGPPQLEMVTSLECAEGGGGVRAVLWQPSGDSHTLVGVCEGGLTCWDLDTGSGVAKISWSKSLEGSKGSHSKLQCGKWSPHHGGNQVATASDTSIRGWDLRTMSQAYCIDGAHGSQVRDLDFNPNRQYLLASCGDDCKVKIWDTRTLANPLKVMSEHSHWVWSVRYNNFHDQLVLTSSSDSRVVMHRVVSLSSEPYGHLVDDEDDDEEGKEGDEDSLKESTPPEDAVVRVYEEHEDSVYDVAWSTSDPWTFASLSYDGRLVINRVPRGEKYNILL